MDCNGEKMLRELMAVDFTLIELNLYLNTHPCDMRALTLYNCTVQNAIMLRAQYENMYGPLNTRYSYSKYPWQWNESPWPWEG